MSRVETQTRLHGARTIKGRGGQGRVKMRACLGRGTKDATATRRITSLSPVRGGEEPPILSIPLALPHGGRGIGGVAPGILTVFLA